METQDIKIGAIIAGLVFGLVVGIMSLPYLFPESEVIRYRMTTRSSQDVGEYPVIIEVVENGMDEEIELPTKTVEEAMVILDSLNSKLK